MLSLGVEGLAANINRCARHWSKCLADQPGDVRGQGGNAAGGYPRGHARATEGTK